MDANRQKAGRMDWLCCFKGNARYTELEEEASSANFSPNVLPQLVSCLDSPNVVKVPLPGGMV